MEEVKFWELGKVRNIVEATGNEIVHLDEDLVFIEKNTFLLRFDKEDLSLVHIHFNVDCDEEQQKWLEETLLKNAEIDKVKMVVSSKYVMENIEGKEEVQLRFID